MTKIDITILCSRAHFIIIHFHSHSHSHFPTHYLIFSMCKDLAWARKIESTHPRDITQFLRFHFKLIFFPDSCIPCKWRARLHWNGPVGLLNGNAHSKVFRARFVYKLITMRKKGNNNNNKNNSSGEQKHQQHENNNNKKTGSVYIVITFHTFRYITTINLGRRIQHKHKWWKETQWLVFTQPKWCLSVLKYT